MRCQVFKIFSISKFSRFQQYRGGKGEKRIYAHRLAPKVKCFHSVFRNKRSLEREWKYPFLEISIIIVLARSRESDNIGIPPTGTKAFCLLH